MLLFASLLTAVERTVERTSFSRFAAQDVNIFHRHKDAARAEFVSTKSDLNTQTATSRGSESEWLPKDAASKGTSIMGSAWPTLTEEKEGRLAARVDGSDL
jgi:hypothetical protein